MLFSDGVNVAIVTTNSAGDNFVARFYSNDSNEAAASLMTCVKELPLKLARKCIEVVGAPFVEDAPAAAVAVRGKKHQVDFGSDDEMLTMQSGKDFTLLMTNQGRVYYTGKSSSIGHKQVCQPGQWNEMNISKGPKISQVHILFINNFNLILTVP